MEDGSQQRIDDVFSNVKIHFSFCVPLFFFVLPFVSVSAWTFFRMEIIPAVKCSPPPQKLLIV